MALSGRQILQSLSRMPFIDSAELALIIGEPHTTVHRALTSLLADGIAGRVSHGTAHLPSSQRYYLTGSGIREAARMLAFDTPSDFVRAYPVSREWLALLIRRMDAVASVYRLAASLSPWVDGLRSHVEFHRRGRFDATITLHDGLSFGVVRQGLALRRRSLYDRLRAIAGYDYTRRPDAVLVLTPSVWELRLTTRFCMDMAMRDCYVAVESRDALERRDIPVWRGTSILFGGRYCTLETVVFHGSPGRGLRTESPSRKRASIPDPERMVEAAPAFGITPSEKRTLDLITDHPVIPRAHLATWLGVSEGRVSQMMHNLGKTWGLIERHGKRGDVRYTLSAEGIRYVTHRDRAKLPTTRGIWSTALTTDKQGRRRHVGHRIETWARQTKHADGITWFLSQLEAESREDSSSELQWSVPTARSDRAYNWGESPSPPTPWGICLPAAFTCRSILSMSYVPVTPGESLPAWTPMRATTGLPHRRKTSLRSPPRCSSWTPRRSRTPTCARRPSWPPCRCPSSCRALQCCPPQGYLESPGVPSGRLSPPDWRYLACGPTDGTPSTTGCVL